MRRRIFSDFTHGEGTRAGCYWPTAAERPELPVARGALTNPIGLALDRYKYMLGLVRAAVPPVPG